MGMSSSAIVPSTQIRTSTIGPTATMPSAGWRSVTQKKTLSMTRATATVVLIASVCRSVIWSVTETAMMLGEIAVTSSSSPNQRSSICPWAILVPSGSSR